MKEIIKILILFVFASSLAQVGINNTDPKATLDISASDASAPSNTDGILIPRIDAFPVSNPTVDQQGMLVYLTTISGSNSPGFYYWDDIATAWYSVGGTHNGNTLDQAYDEGGTGVGSTINATDGVVTIAGQDGFLVTGIEGTGDNILISGLGTRMFFNPRKSAFRAGTIDDTLDGTQWDSSNVGDYSTAFGQNTIASGNHSTALGNYTEASGLGSIVMGIGSIASGNYTIALGKNTLAPSYAETSIGYNNTEYIPVSTTTKNNNDRLFTIGNGTSYINRSNALIIYKNGLMNINEEYNMPLIDGTSNQVMATDGSGQVDFVDVSSIFTGNQNISGSGLSGTDLTIGIQNGTSEVVDLSPLKNTLDDAYNQGGPGSGKTIDATDGAVTIAGQDGFLVTGAGYNATGNTLPVLGEGARMFFSPNTSAFRAGEVRDFGTYGDNVWDEENLGDYSVGMGLNSVASERGTIALGSSASATAINAIAIGGGTNATGTGSVAFGRSTDAIGEYATAGGYFSEALGDYSIVIGREADAKSYGEIVFGVYPTDYSASSTTSFVDTDRLFTVGNGTNGSNTSNALTIFKNGLMNINEEYNMPLIDGIANQIMATDGSGNVSFNTFIEENSTASNGLTETANDIRMGGTLTQDTNFDYGNFDTRFNLNGTGDFIIQDTGSGVFTVNDAGNSIVGRNMTWRESSITGTIIGQMLTDGTDDGRFTVRENGDIAVDLRANTEFIFNQQGADRDFRVESDGNQNMLLVNAGNNSVGIGGNPDTDLHTFHNDTAASAGFKIQNQGANNNWWRMFTSNNNGNLYIYSTLGGTIPRGNFDDNTGVYSATSDRRLKKDFKSLPFSWQNFMNLETLSYLYKSQKDDTRSLGLIAQDVKLIYPELVNYNKQYDVYHMNYSGFGVIAIKAVQELKKEIEVLKEENQKLQNQLLKYEALESRLNNIENILGETISLQLMPGKE